MALVTCPDCEAQISDAATACLHCGRPMKREVAGAPVLIEQSSKKYKRGMLIGLGGIPAAFVLALIGANGISPGVSQTFATLAIIVALAGVALFVFNFIARWWHHG